MDAGEDQRAKGSRSGGPLSGIRVLDLTAVVLGPIATQILGDYGGDVVKVESPSGDLMRLNGVSLHRGMSSIFLALNRNKRSLALDLQTADGKAVLRRLVPGFDVVVHNMRVEAIERLGFGYEAVRALKPDIVYCAATGFDEDGPEAGRPAFDDIIQAASGLASVASIGRATPDYVASLIADKTTGMALVNAILAALLHHARTGSGQYVEVPMLETMTAFVLAEHLGGLTFEGHAAPPGYARLMEGGRKPVRTADGFMAILPYSAGHWRSFFEAAGRPDIAEAYADEDRARRNENNAKLYAALQEIGPRRTTAAWMAICHEADIPATPIYALADLPEHPQLKAVGLFQEMEHPSEGRIRAIRPTTKFAATPGAIRLPRRCLGLTADMFWLKRDCRMPRSTIWYHEASSSSSPHHETQRPRPIWSMLFGGVAVPISSSNATTCVRATEGKPSRNSSMLSPASSESMSARIGTRVPSKTGAPLIISGWRLTTKAMGEV